jgi:hypothetical protein
VTQEITVSNAPRLFPVAGMAPWDHEYGIVKKPAELVPTGATTVAGWMELELPDGARIKKMSVFGTVTGGGDGALTIKLKRQRIINPSSPVDLIAIKVPDGNDATKGLDGDVTGGDTGIGPNGIEELLHRQQPRAEAPPGRRAEGGGDGGSSTPSRSFSGQ